MSVRFILGRSGTGKTSWCIERIVESLLDDRDGRPLVFLVPEQATYQAERAILSDSRVGGYNRLNVLSFERLGYLLLGKNTARRNLSQIGRQMVVQRLLRVHSGKLKIFGGAADRVGTGRAIAQTIAEFHRCGSGAENIDEIVETLAKYDSGSVTSMKFADIAIIFKEYLKFIEGKFIDSDVQLGMAKEAVSKSPIIKGGKLWMDGFAGFTAGELSMLAEVLRNVADAHIALCVDPATLDMRGDLAAIDETSLFGPTEKTYCELLEVVKRCKLKIDKPIVLNKARRFDNCPALLHVEKEFASFNPKQGQAKRSVKISAAANGRVEVQYVAREILRLVKEKGIRYRDIAVVASDIDYYEHYLRAYLEDYGMPHFIDKRRSLRQHPVISLVLSALSVVTEGFSQAEIFNYLKTGLIGLDNYEIDLLENYCVAFGVRQQDWEEEKKWDYAGADDGRFDNYKADKLRRKVVGPLLGLQEGVCARDEQKQISAEEFTRVLFDFLDGLDIQIRLNKLIEEAMEKGDSEQANFHQQFCERFAEVFDEMNEAFTDIQMSCGDWTEVLKAAVGQMSLAFIPPRLDQVLVGSIERSRHPDLKVVFLIGCTQKQFPSPIGYDCILTETDRQIVGSADFPLGPSVRDELSQREYLAYIAFTRASEYLYVSYPAVDDRGSATVCSRYVERLSSLFSDVQIERVDSEQIDIDSVNTTSELAQFICNRGGAEADDNEQVRKIRRLAVELCDDNELKGTGELVEYALDYNNVAELEKGFVNKIYGKTMRCSATRLGTFAACPYQHFAKYVLGLEEREEFKFEPLDKGLFYHKVLDSFVKELNVQGIDFTQVGSKELLKILRGRVDFLLNDDSFTRSFFARSEHNAYIIRAASETLEQFVLAAAEMSRAGDFRAKLSEVRFGDKDSELGICRLVCKDGREIVLNGLIDRLDTVVIDGTETSVIFDYKLSGRSFSFSKFHYGIDIQLGIYMLAAKAGGFRVAGAFYVPIETTVKRAALGDVDIASEKFGYKCKGIFDGRYAGHIDRTVQSRWSRYYNFGVSKDDGQYGYYSSSGAMKPEDFEKFISITEQKVCEIAGQVAAGNIDVSPYRLNNNIPCGWCKYRSVCRFDWQVNKYRELQTVDKVDFLKSAEGGDG